MDETPLTRREVLSGLAVVGGTGTFVGNYTAALFVDEERHGTTLTAGGVDLVVDTPGGSSEGGVTLPVKLTRGEDDVPRDRTELSVSPKEESESNPVYPWLGASCPDPPGIARRLWVTLRYAGTEEDGVIAEGTLLGVAHLLRDGVALDPDGEDTDPRDRACLSPEESIGLVFEWELLPGPIPSSGGNDSITIDFEFVGRQCRHTDGTESPFPDDTDCSGVGHGISFIAFCEMSSDLQPEDVEVTVEERNDDGEPVTVAWTDERQGNAVDYVTVFFGSQGSPTMKIYDIGDARAGTVTSIGIGDAAARIEDARGKTASIPCETAHERLGGAGDFDGTTVKLEYRDGDDFKLEDST